MSRPNKNQPAAEPRAPFSPAEIDALFSPFLNYPSILLAVSGGSDSMALLHLAHLWAERPANAPQLHVASVDHGLRSGSSAECAHVERACRLRGVPYFYLKWEGEKPASALQANARDARYSLLASLAQQRGFAAIATAHTQDDQAETVLMRLARGSGLAGLSAMQPVSLKHAVPLLRPFLAVTRESLRNVLQEDGMSWCEDASNADARFLRPRLRALLPQLAQEGLDAARFALFAKKTARANAALDAAVDILLDACAVRGLPIEKYRAAPEEIRLRALARLITLASPSAYSPADDSLEQLDAALCSGDAVRRTLGGAVISSKQGFLACEAENDPRKAR